MSAALIAQAGIECNIAFARNKSQFFSVDFSGEQPRMVRAKEDPMKKTLILASFLALATPAFANQCPTLMKKVDEAMMTAKLDDATKKQVMDLYAKGKAEHEAGKHDQSVADLNTALKLLGQ